jgi:poly(A) polymerase
MISNRELLSNVPPARLFDEFLKMFQAGHAGKTFELLRKFDLFRLLFPETDAELNENGQFLEFVRLALSNTDGRVAREDSVTPMFLLGVFFWEPVRKRADQLRAKEKMSVVQSLSIASFELSGLQQSRVSIPRRFTTPMREMLAMQPRFDVHRGKRALRLLEHRRFRAAYDFMMLRSKCGDFDKELAAFWTDVQVQNGEQRSKSFDLHDKTTPSRRRRPRRRKSRGADRP